MKTIALSTVLAALVAVVIAVQPAHAKDAAKLGTPQAAGPFQVTLTTIPAVPQSGSNLFRVEVIRKGEVVSDAQVALTLTMPIHRHGGRSGREPKISCNLAFQNGAYAGRARLPMSTTWRAQVDVKTATEKGTALYQFRVGK